MGPSRFLLIASLALLATMPVGAVEQKTGLAPQRELIYGAELMTPQERERYRKRLRGAADPKSEAKVREQHQRQMRERARKRGVELEDPAGIVHRKD